ncbi:hypothetical protein TELCIR_00306 [Teladorsagia circumcincta]|uniref:MICOS complex subunit MIC60 n=1 Tax=Teladorsagia circumcincta TaxID=45464 RepID=A0A2G9V539_TELCI|nr:hypothetical protein TELCIR_00306 [Teladorsagia circumcincta]
MLRAVTKKSLNRGVKGVRVLSTQAAPTAPPVPPVPRVPPTSPPHVPKPAAPPRKSGRKVVYTVGALAAAAAGVIGYAYVDPEFRNKVETTVPQAKQVFDTVLGSSSLSKTKQQLLDLKDQAANVLPKKKVEEVLPPLSRYTLPEFDKKPPVHVDPVDVKTAVDTGDAKPSPEIIAKRAKELESSLLSAIHSAESKVSAATDAKIKTITAINEHAALVKATVDEPQNADWEKVGLTRHIVILSVKIAAMARSK